MSLSTPLTQTPLLPGREPNPSDERSYRFSRYYGGVLLLLLVPCYFQIEHDWTASTRIEEVTGILYDGTENRTADRTEQVNAGSSSARILLAMYAIVGLILPCASRFRLGTPAFLGVFGYVGWMMLTILWAREPSQTGFKLMVLLVFCLTAFGYSRQLTMDQIGRLFGMAAVIYLLIGFAAEIRFGAFHFGGDYRFTGSVHPNTEAAYGSLACLSAGLFYRPDDRKTVLLVAAVFSIGLLCLLLTKSRTSLAAMFVGLTAFHAIRLRGMKRLILISAAICVASLGVLVVTVAGSQLKSAVGDAAAMGRADDVTSLTGRLPLWEELLEWVAQRPLVGYGYMSMWTPERVEYLGDLFHWEIPHAHNMYIDTLLDGGIIGLFFLILYLLLGLLGSARRFLGTGQAGAAFCFAMIVFAMVHGSAESFFKQCVFVNLCIFTLLFRLAWSGPEDEEVEQVEQADGTDDDPVGPNPTVRLRPSGPVLAHSPWNVDPVRRITV